MDYFTHNASKGTPSPLYRAIRRESEAARAPRNDREANRMLAQDILYRRNEARRMSQAAPVVTYWLYYFGDPLTSVRMPEGARAEDVIAKAYADHKACPALRTEYAPYEFARMLPLCEVRK